MQSLSFLVCTTKERNPTTPICYMKISITRNILYFMPVLRMKPLENVSFLLHLSTAYLQLIISQV